LQENRLKEKQISVEKNVVGYFKVLTDGTTIELKKSNIKKVYDLDVLEHDTYPYKPAMIKFEERTFVLSQKLASDVRQEDAEDRRLKKIIKMNLRMMIVTFIVSFAFFWLTVKLFDKYIF